MLAKKSQKLRRKPSKVQLDKTNKDCPPTLRRTSIPRLSPLGRDYNSQSAQTLKLNFSPKGVAARPLRVKMVKVYRAYAQQQSFLTNQPAEPGPNCLDLANQLRTLKEKHKKLRQEASRSERLEYELARVQQENCKLKTVASQTLDQAMIEFQHTFEAVIKKMTVK